jgi:hypothetical protein
VAGASLGAGLGGSAGWTVVAGAFSSAVLGCSLGLEHPIRKSASKTAAQMALDCNWR